MALRCYKPLNNPCRGVFKSFLTNCSMLFLSFTLHCNAVIIKLHSLLYICHYLFGWMYKIFYSFNPSSIDNWWVWSFTEVPFFLSTLFSNSLKTMGLLLDANLNIWHQIGIKFEHMSSKWLICTCQASF